MPLAATVKFNQSLYYVIEDSGSAYPTLVLSNPISSNIIVDVVSTNLTALGEHYVVQLYVVTNACVMYDR